MQLIVWLAGGAAGVVASVAVSVALGHSSRSRELVREPSVLAPVAVAAEGLRPLPSEVSAAPTAPASSASAPPQTSAPHAKPDVTRASPIAREEEHARLVQAARAEPIDPRWAPGAERSFEADLARVRGKAGYDVVGVTCHTTTCLATLEWPTLAAAQRGYASVLYNRYETNCARRVVLEPGADPSTRFQTTVIFDCESSRVE